MRKAERKGGRGRERVVNKEKGWRNREGDMKIERGKRENTRKKGKKTDIDE